MLASTLSALVLVAAAAAHIVISYPGWRGNNLITNETFPYGMQWTFPCGGTPLTQNRTYWPTTGGAVAFQPGWFQGHLTATVHINMGFGTGGPDGGPLNMSNTMGVPFQILGPSKNPYPGTVCLPQLPMPNNVTVKAGDNATIQIVEHAMHGAALYSCVDITFAEPGDERIAEVNSTNCFNSTDIGAADIYTITTRASGSNTVVKSGAEAVLRSSALLGWAPLLAAGAFLLA
ncbi:hypothetical protein VD0002_g3967 [Verticillium dahliae]|uniref:Copper acquisition factor BIM1-like domain-containing protein n=2 Tax=Verticillium dahliae TaxID=27337 RepID=G2WVP4_VERDV|nr:uncharacterized protein VDAG_01680 [Verticillium dahliae VdLs.17]KAF3343346.1 Minor extracellular protease vpr [Verticillium dahliae VDG2]KAH6705959.1 hypothetical protein EV126DRAFT_334646 [Verticillium dahliae]EGY19664.1 hypothetical protein VDAG_01680 [Verticillium dahliae VdLs.17]PNH32908.1 hypothetical protein BJF96_g3676 [Verticillium dahliae]PNH52394.1 hypothetical protein VD0003_g4934 [Verticillium dahliae]